MSAGTLPAMSSSPSSPRLEMRRPTKFAGEAWRIFLERPARSSRRRLRKRIAARLGSILCFPPFQARRATLAVSLTTMTERSPARATHGASALVGMAPSATGLGQPRNEFLNFRVRQPSPCRSRDHSDRNIGGAPLGMGVGWRARSVTCQCPADKSRQLTSKFVRSRQTRALPDNCRTIYIIKYNNG